MEFHASIYVHTEANCTASKRPYSQVDTAARPDIRMQQYDVRCTKMHLPLARLCAAIHSMPRPSAQPAPQGWWYRTYPPTSTTLASFQHRVTSTSTTCYNQKLKVMVFQCFVSIFIPQSITRHSTCLKYIYLKAFCKPPSGHRA